MCRLLGCLEAFVIGCVIFILFGNSAWGIGFDSSLGYFEDRTIAVGNYTDSNGGFNLEFSVDTQVGMNVMSQMD